MSKLNYYKDANSEKILRANIKSSVENKLSKETLVIVDNLNYIKGFRYEHYCQARNAQTTLCVLWCDIDQKICKQWC